MNELLKVGDSVRVVGCEKFKPASEDAACVLSGKAIVKVMEFGKNWTRISYNDKFYFVPTKYLRHAAEPRRSFEEIIKELAENPDISCAGLKLINVRPADSTSGGLADFTDRAGFGELTIYDDGGISIKYREDWTWQSLSAISAACSEIAANYQAEHGKGEA